MEHLLSQSSLPRSDQTTFHAPKHPKIKPLLRRYCREYQLNQINYQKSLKAHPRTFKAARINTDKGEKTLPHFLEGHRKILTSQDCLSKLSYSFYDPLRLENAYLTKIRSLSNITFLGLRIIVDREHQIPLKVLFKSLAYLKDLTHFKFELYFFIFTEMPIICLLYKSLRCLKNLENLSLCFSCSLEKVLVKGLPQCLIHMKQLKSLTLSFGALRQLTEQDILSLVSIFPKLPLLTQASLNFTGQRGIIKGSTVVAIFHNMTSISEITLNLRNSDVSNENCPDPLVEGLLQLETSSLRKLSLHLYRNLSPQNLIKLSQTLTRFTSLNILRLSFLDCYALANNTVAAFGLALSSLTTLSSLSLAVHQMVADSLLGCIASALKSLHNLGNLRLIFASKMSYSLEQIQQLSTTLGSLVRLRFLNIIFNSQEFLSDEVLERFGQSLQKLVLLKDLTLDFAYAKVVTNQGVKALMNGIQNLHSLFFLDLNFKRNTEIDEKAVEEIARALKQLSSLYSTNFKFPGCLKLNQKEGSLSSLFHVLKEMKNIREVVLVLDQNEFNKQEIRDLEQRKTLTLYSSE